MFGQNTKNAKKKFIIAAGADIAETLLGKLDKDEKVNAKLILDYVKKRAQRLDDILNKDKIEALIGDKGAVDLLVKSFSTSRNSNFVKLVKGATTNGDLKYYLTRTVPLSPVDAQDMSKIRIYLVNYLGLEKNDEENIDPDDYSEEAIAKKLKNVTGIPRTFSDRIEKLKRKKHKDINEKAHGNRLINRLKIIVTAWLIALIDLKPIGPEINKIEDNEYLGRKDLKDFEIVDTVTSIGSCAFKDCINLSNIKMSNNITEIGEFAFSGCQKLNNVIYLGRLKKLENLHFPAVQV